MIKRHGATLLYFLAFCLALGAQDKPTSPASMLSGEVTLEAGETNLLKSPYVADIPGLSSKLVGSGINIKFSDGVSRSYLDSYQQLEDVRHSTRMGFEAGVTFDAANLYKFTAETNKTSSNGDSSFYNLLQPMIDWYENNHGRYGMAASPYPSGSWPTDNYDASTSGRTRFIYGKTAEPLSCVAWDFTKWYDAQKLVSEIKLKIELAIDKISPDASSGKIVDQYAYAKLTGAARRLAQAELEAWTAFHLVTDREDSYAKVEDLVKAAYVRFTNIGGVLDARLDFGGVSLSNGSLVPSGRLDQPDSGPALALALPAGLVPGFSLAATADLVGGSPAVVEDWLTKDSEALPGEASWLGLRLKGGYSLPDVANVSLSILWPDLAERPATIGATVNADLHRKGSLAYNLALEASFLLWQDRYLSAPANVTAFAGGIDADLTVFGATPRLLALYKSAGFWGEGGNDAEDRFPGLDLREDFNYAKVKDALALDFGLGFDPAAFLGNMKIVSAKGGYKLFLYDLAKNGLAALGQGWYAGLDLSLLDLAELPLSFSAEITNYTNWGIYAGKYDDWNKAPAAGLLSGLTWSASLAWEPTKEIVISLKGSGHESGWRMDTQPVVAVGLEAMIKF